MQPSKPSNISYMNLLRQDIDPIYARTREIIPNKKKKKPRASSINCVVWRLFKCLRWAPSWAPLHPTEADPSYERKGIPHPSKITLI